MVDRSTGVGVDEQVARLSRRQRHGIKDEHALVAVAGATVPAWTVKVTSLDSYNFYNVRQVSVNAPGVLPSTVGSNDVQAYNLAESFLSSGNVASGTYAVMWRVGDKNVIYVEP